MHDMHYASKPHDETVLRDDSGSRTWLYTQTSAKLTQGTEDAAAREAAGKGPAVVLSGGNQPTLAMEDTLHMLFDKHMPVLLKHHPAQVRPSSFRVVFMPTCSCYFFEFGVRSAANPSVIQPCLPPDDRNSGFSS
jgi:hypothetical protein